MRLVLPIRRKKKVHRNGSLSGATNAQRGRMTQDPPLTTDGKEDGGGQVGEAAGDTSGANRAREVSRSAARRN